MKRLFVFSIALVLCAGLLTGCDGSGSPSDREPAEISGEIYSTGEFQAFVPEGWRTYPITDPFAEGDPVKTDCFFLNKGGERDWHVSQKPYIRLEHFGPGEEIDEPIPDPALERDVEECPALRFGDLTWNGYAANSYHGRARIGRFAILWTEKDNHKYQAFVWFQSGGEGIRLEDADLQAILASLAPADGVSSDTE